MKQASHIYSRSMEKKNRRDSAAFPVRPKKEWDTGRKKLTHKTTLFVSFTRVCIYPRIYLSMRVCICVRVCMYVSFACIYICIYIYRDISSKNISSKLATIKISRKLANACVSRYIYVCICICACVCCVCICTTIFDSISFLWFVISPFTRIVKWKILLLQGEWKLKLVVVSKKKLLLYCIAFSVYGDRFLRMRGQRDECPCHFYRRWFNRRFDLYF